MINHLKLWMLTAILFMSGNLLVMGQDQREGEHGSGEEAGELFTVATLNVDGLPRKILVVKLNSEGPADTGTARIGKYLQKKGYDLLFLQEDFNYHGVLSVFLEDDYRFDEWSGDVGLDGHKIDFLHLQNHRFECDGLMACWKNELSVTPAGRTAWTQNFGKFSHANDEMVTKGFRRYDVTLKDGTRLTVYNMHMDATLDEDEAEQKGTPDREARQAQWTQLKNDVLQHVGSHPVIIVGDLNSFYGRDHVKSLFIDAINDSGLGTAGDVWVELEHQGVYPGENSLGTDYSNIRDGESLDKILYINPAMGTKIRPVAYSLDREGYQYDGKPLGDHYPVVATFQVVSGTTGIVEMEDVSNGSSEECGNGEVYNLNGVRVQQPHSGLYIKRQGEKVNKRVIK